MNKVFFTLCCFLAMSRAMAKDCDELNTQVEALKENLQRIDVSIDTDRHYLDYYKGLYNTNNCNYAHEENAVCNDIKNKLDHYENHYRTMIIARDRVESQYNDASRKLKICKLEP